MKKFISEKIKNIPPSGIRKYFDLINEMDDVISLGVGEPDFVTPWNIREAGIYSLEKGFTHYSSNAGFIELRKAISQYLNKKYSLKYLPESQVLVTVGGSEGIDCILRAVISAGDEVIIPQPSFVAYDGCAAFSGAKIVHVELKEENSFKLMPDDLEKKITKKTKAVIIPFPNNPTGSIMTRDELSDIVKVLKDKDILVISDEIYSELTYDSRHASIASFEEMYDKTIVINGFSKAFAMTGWRLGYTCGHPDIIDAMKKIHQYALMCAPTTAQYAAIEALHNSDDKVGEMVAEYKRRRNVIVKGINNTGLSCYMPEGAFYIFPNIRKTGLTSDEFCERLLMEEKVLVVPGTAFGTGSEGYIRATYASSMENIKKALARIDRFVKRNVGG